MKKLLLFSLSLGLLCACQKKEDDSPATSDPKLRIQFKFDPNQERLNNLGQEAPMPLGHAGQSPDFNALSAYYFELVPTKFTQLEDGGDETYRYSATSIRKLPREKQRQPNLTVFGTLV